MRNSILTGLVVCSALMTGCAAMGLPPVNLIAGKISGDIYTAPDKSFSVELPFRKDAESYERRYLRIQDNRSQDGAFNVTFGPAAFNRAYYRVMIAPKDLPIVKEFGKKDMNDAEIRQATLAGARSLVEHTYQAKTSILSEETLVHDGQTVQYTSFVQRSVKSYPGLSTPHEITVCGGVYIYVHQTHIVRFWVENAGVLGGPCDDQFRTRSYPRMQAVLDSLHLLPLPAR